MLAVAPVAALIRTIHNTKNKPSPEAEGVRNAKAARQEKES